MEPMIEYFVIGWQALMGGAQALSANQPHEKFMFHWFCSQRE